MAYPRTNELYVFNRHGHHIETQDLVTGRTLYSFLYSKNTSFGRLSKVTDSSGNKVMFLRDYNSAVSQVSAKDRYWYSGMKCALGAERSPSARVRILATVRGEIGHPLGVTVPKWVGFQVVGFY